MNPNRNEKPPAAGRNGKAPLAAIEHATFGLTFHLDDTRALVLVTGEVDLASSTRLKECVDLLIEQGVFQIDVDLREVTFLDSEGMALLVNLDRRMSEAGGRLRVLHPQAFVQRVFRIAGVDQFLEVIS